jgi:hypothetical protein
MVLGRKSGVYGCLDEPEPDEPNEPDEPDEPEHDEQSCEQLVETFCEKFPNICEEYPTVADKMLDRCEKMWSPEYKNRQTMVPQSDNGIER